MDGYGESPALRLRNLSKIKPTSDTRNPLGYGPGDSSLKRQLSMIYHLNDILRGNRKGPGRIKIKFERRRLQ